MARSSVLLAAWIVLATMAAPVRAAAQAPASCPVTVAPDSEFTPPAPYPSRPYPGRFWYGTPALWTSLKANGTVWSAPRRGDKVFWWQMGYNGRFEQQPELTVTARRLDGDAQPLLINRRATNAHHKDFGGWTMLTGVALPTAGCWEVTGQYGGATLTFVVWVT